MCETKRVNSCANTRCSHVDDGHGRSSTSSHDDVDEDELRSLFSIMDGANGAHDDVDSGIATGCGSILLCWFAIDFAIDWLLAIAIDCSGLKTNGSLLSTRCGLQSTGDITTRAYCAVPL